MSQAKIPVSIAGAAAILCVIAIAGLLYADAIHIPASSFTLEGSVWSSGASHGSAPVYRINGTLGQSTPAGYGLAGGILLRAGFWARPPVANSGTAVPGWQPAGDYLFQNFPNPFSSSTTIDYMLSAECMVEVTVFNVRGQRVKTLLGQRQGPGRHCAVWDGLDGSGQEASPGIYFYRLDADDFTCVRKMVLAR